MDTLDERWQRDRDLFVERAKELDAEVMVEAAERDDAKQLQQAESLLERGAQALVVVPHNAETAGKIVEAAKKKSVGVISYDRLILNADVDLYLSYDNKRVGEQQAQQLRNQAPEGQLHRPRRRADRLQREADSRRPDERAARTRSRGATSRSWPSRGRRTGARTWRRTLTAAALKKARNQVVAIVASNDTTAGGAIAALEQAGLAGKVCGLGQDANLDAVRRIVQGTQTMTVYKPLRPLARGAASAAVQLAKKEKVEGTSTVNNGMKDVQAMLLSPIAVHKDLDRPAHHRRQVPHPRSGLRSGRRQEIADWRPTSS